MENNKIIITERNRDGAKIWLEPVHERSDFYTVHADAKHQYVLEYCSVNYDPVPDDAEDYDGEWEYPDGKIVKYMIHSFDPAGGPYMTPGYKFEGGYKLARIFERLGEPVLFKLIKE